MMGGRQGSGAGPAQGQLTDGSPVLSTGAGGVGVGPRPHLPYARVRADRRAPSSSPPATTMDRTFSVLALLLAVTLLAAGCGSSEPSSISATTSPPDDLSTVLTVTVHNDQLDEVRTWLIVEGQRVRMGPVRAGSSQTFYYALPGNRQVRLEFDVTLGRRCVTQDAPLKPGDDVSVRIPAQLIAFTGVCR